MAELADAPDLGSGSKECRFKSCYPHHKGSAFSGAPLVVRVLGKGNLHRERPRERSFSALAVRIVSISTKTAASARSVSNPVTRTIKETSFVYHGKRRFFLHFGQKSSKIKQNRASARSIDFSGAQFFAFSPQKCPKMLVYFLRFLALLRKQKSVGFRGFEPKAGGKTQMSIIRAKKV